jgi:hypothetical protein
VDAVADNESLLESFDETTLTPLLRRALQNDTVDVSTWGIRQVYGGAGFGAAGGSAVHRVSGLAHDRGDTLDWSLILKVLYPPAALSDATDWDYWRREAHVFESGLLEDVPGGLSAPRCFGVHDQPNGQCWIWLEDLKDDIGSEWPLDHYCVVARHLGRFNGAYLTERPLPTYPWLSREWLRGAVADAAPAIDRLRHAADHPLLRRACPPRILDDFLARWDERKMVLSALDRLPHTLCHFDPFRRNLFARCGCDGRYDTVGIDWANTGIGALGWDIHILVASTLAWREIDVSRTRELDCIAFEGYLEGLKDAGWEGDPRQVRLGQTLPICLWNIRTLHMPVSTLLDEGRHGWLKESFGYSSSELADRLAQLWEHPLTPSYWEKEARDLMEEI